MGKTDFCRKKYSYSFEKSNNAEVVSAFRRLAQMGQIRRFDTGAGTIYSFFCWSARILIYQHSPPVDLTLRIGSVHSNIASICSV